MIDSFKREASNDDYKLEILRKSLRGDLSLTKETFEKSVSLALRPLNF
jgi:hypothetical protein